MRQIMFQLNLFINFLLPTLHKQQKLAYSSICTVQ